MLLRPPVSAFVLTGLPEEITARTFARAIRDDPARVRARLPAVGGHALTEAVHARAGRVGSPAMCRLAAALNAAACHSDDRPSAPMPFLPHERAS